MKKMIAVVVMLLMLCGSVVAGEVTIAGTDISPKSNLYDNASGGKIEWSTGISDTWIGGFSFGYNRWDLTSQNWNTSKTFTVWEPTTIRHGHSTSTVWFPEEVTATTTHNMDGYLDDYSFGASLSQPWFLSRGVYLISQAGLKYHWIDTDAEYTKTSPCGKVRTESVSVGNTWTADLGVSLIYNLTKGINFNVGGGYQWDISRQSVYIGDSAWKQNDFSGYFGQIGLTFTF